MASEKSNSSEKESSGAKTSKGGKFSLLAGPIADNLKKKRKRQKQKNAARCII